MTMPVCFVDLDGVLVDFVGGALKLHNKPLPMDVVTWDFDQQVGLSAQEFWSPLGEEFWANLEWTAEGVALLVCLDELFRGRVALLSSPCATPGCCDGKRQWVRKHLGPDWLKRLMLSSAKHLFAAPGKVLIDDNNENVDAFVGAGGRAVLTPRPWNRRRHECETGGRFNVAKLLDEVEKGLEDF